MVLGLILLALCGPLGDASTPEEKALNPFKNRDALATQFSDISLFDLVAPDDCKKCSNDQAAVISGICREVKDGGKESCNCHSAKNKDTHIAISRSPTDPKSEWIIVEVTPRSRAQFGLGTTSQLKRQLLGRTIKVSGWLFFDSEHTGNATNTNPKGKRNWRKSCWEIHPVQKIEVLYGCDVRNFRGNAA